ncbi:Cutinase transcription factor 1 alpha [Gigaspora margarita]|uniref:Cutinase transcription factor 1 alpha n=1 Tax=Gigaspora margarita TaxID=4874 RepID=A0A8H4A8Z6_GIGMA|nr:Cutinase transcription factor 1 alpha [Gigaspora margarita]
MSFPRQQQQQQKQQQRQRRGFYVTRACTNCKEKHAKCSGGATCERCTLRNLECTFIDSGKKRGPKTDGKHAVQFNASNGSENYYDGTSVLPSMITNPAQGHLSTLSLFGYPQQQPYGVTEFYDPEQVHILNNVENDFDGTSMLYSMSPNPVQGHASTLSLSGYPIQQSDNIENVTLYSDYCEKKTAYAYQEVDPFSYQPCTNTGFIMQNDNNFIDNTPINNNTVYFTSDNKHPWPAL